MADHIINALDLTPEQLAARTGMSIARCRELLAIGRGEWQGDVEVIGDDGKTIPEHHGETWTTE